MIHTMTPLEKLVLARAIIEEPENWCKGSYARNSDGNPTLEDYQDAVCFCVAGACRLACADTNFLRRALPFGYAILIQFNDGPATLHEDILAVFDRAIDRLLTGNDCYCP